MGGSTRINLLYIYIIRMIQCFKGTVYKSVAVIIQWLISLCIEFQNSWINLVSMRICGRFGHRVMGVEVGNLGERPIQI